MQTLTFVGLGNPGDRYENTRHNLGIAVLRQWVEHVQQVIDGAATWQQRGGVDRIIINIPVPQAGVTRVHALFPLTFMNYSGEAVAAYLRHENLPVSSVLVVHDEIELPAGEVRLVRGGSAKGHNGVRSIFHSLGTPEIARLRLGIGRAPEQPVDEYVLGKFSSAEAGLVQEIAQKAMTVLDQVCQAGIDANRN